MRYLVVNNLSDLSDTTDCSLIFVDTIVDQPIFCRLLDLHLNNDIIAYVQVNNKYAQHNIIYEREKIKIGMTNGLEHYHQLDFFKNQFNDYLSINKYNVNAEVNNLDDFRREQQSYYNLLLETDKNKLIIETYCEVNEQLKQDINLFHYTVDANSIALTTNSKLFYTYCEQLDDAYKVISKSNRKTSNNYFLLPNCEQYQPMKKVIKIDENDYKHAFQTIRDQNFIVVLSDVLIANQYIVDSCKKNDIKNQLDFQLPSSKYIGQDRTMLLLIKLVESYNQIAIYEFKNDQLIFSKIIRKNEYEYQKMVLSYKNDLYYNNQYK